MNFAPGLLFLWADEASARKLAGRVVQIPSISDSLEGALFSLSLICGFGGRVADGLQVLGQALCLPGSFILSL